MVLQDDSSFTMEAIKVQNISPEISGKNLEPISASKSANIGPVLIQSYNGLLKWYE